MKDELKLTIKDWEVVREQCLNCKLWNEEEGCIYENRADDLPVNECEMFEENKK